MRRDDAAYRVSWGELTLADGSTLPAGQGWVIGATNTHDFVRSDTVVQIHERPDGTTWDEHQLLHLSPGSLTRIP